LHLPLECIGARAIAAVNAAEAAASTAVLPATAAMQTKARLENMTTALWQSDARARPCKASRAKIKRQTSWIA
jgi:hypothetical protein